MSPLAELGGKRVPFLRWSFLRMAHLAEPLMKSGYGAYLMRMLEEKIF